VNSRDGEFPHLCIPGGVSFSLEGNPHLFLSQNPFVVNEPKNLSQNLSHENISSNQNFEQNPEQRIEQNPEQRSEQSTERRTEQNRAEQSSVEQNFAADLNWNQKPSSNVNLPPQNLLPQNLLPQNLMPQNLLHIATSNALKTSEMMDSDTRVQSVDQNAAKNFECNQKHSSNVNVPQNVPENLLPTSSAHSGFMDFHTPPL
jgi:hypothetical protein